MKTIFVILNYKTFSETITITNELLSNGLGDRRVVIVDNASPNEEKTSTENKDTATKATTDNNVKPETDDSLKLPDFMNKEKDNKKSSFSAFPFFNFKNDIK